MDLWRQFIREYLGICDYQAAEYICAEVVGWWIFWSQGMKGGNPSLSLELAFDGWKSGYNSRVMFSGC